MIYSLEPVGSVGSPGRGCLEQPESFSRVQKAHTAWEGSCGSSHGYGGVVEYEGSGRQSRASVPQAGKYTEVHIWAMTSQC